MADIQDLMCYQITKFQKTTTTNTEPEFPEPETTTLNILDSNSKSKSVSDSSIVSTTNAITTEPKGLKTQYSGLFSCNCQHTNNKCSSSSVNLVHYYYCADCERETKKSRTLRFGSGGDVVVDKDYQNVGPDKPAVNGSNCPESTANSTNCFTVSIQLPKSFDFNLLSNQSHRLSININISENKNSKHRLLSSSSSCPISPSSVVGPGAGAGTAVAPATVVNNSGLGHGSILNTHVFLQHSNFNNESSQIIRDIRHNLQFSGWYYGKMDWQDSVRVLKPTPVGTFLLRDSGDPNYCFSLSIQTEHGPISSRISYRNQKFRLDSQERITDMMPTFPTVISLIAHYIKYGLVQNPLARQVWVDSHGYTFSPVHLKEPKRKTVPSLQHMSRLIINQNKNSIDLSNAGVPPRIKSYINDYPYTF